jgi:hypothetical protein
MKNYWLDKKRNREEYERVVRKMIDGDDDIDEDRNDEFFDLSSYINNSPWHQKSTNQPKTSVP